MSRLIYNLGKIDYLNKGKKINSVDLKIELENEINGFTGEEYKSFTVSGNIWSSNHTDICCGGQCLETIAEYIKNNEEFDFIYDMWQKYHLNGLHAGTKEQESVLKKATENGILSSCGANNYKECCDYLKEIGLYEVEVNGKPYKYGTGWLHENIPEEDLERIEYFIENGRLLKEKDIQEEISFE